MRESFIFYRSFFEAIKDLDDKKRLKMYDSIANFALNLEENTNLNGICQQLFILIKPQLLANYEKLEQYQRDKENGKKGAEYGKLGGRPKKNKDSEITPSKTPGGFSKNNPHKNPINANANANVNVNENENVNVNVIDIFCGEEVEKVFKIYQEKCPDLSPLTFERKNREVRQLIADYLIETDRDFEYLGAVCEKSNHLKEIAGKKIDLKMVLKNHIGINNGKYSNKDSPKKELTEDYINDLFNT